CVLLAYERHLQGMPRRHHVMRSAEIRLLRALALRPLADATRVFHHVDLSRLPTDFLGVNSFGSRQIAEHVDHFRIVVCFHLIGENRVAFYGIDFDLISGSEQVGESGHRWGTGRFAHISNSCSSSERSRLSRPNFGWYGRRSPR